MLTWWVDIPHQPSTNTSACSCSISSSSFRTFHSTIPPTPILQEWEPTCLWTCEGHAEQKHLTFISRPQACSFIRAGTQPKASPGNHSILALWPSMIGSSFISGRISLLGCHCFFPVLQAAGKRIEVSPSQSPESSLSPQTLEGI